MQESRRRCRALGRPGERASGRRVRRALVVAIGLVTMIATAGCSGPGGGPAGGVELSGTCQFRACVCIPEDAPTWATGGAEPVRWGSDGKAACQPGYKLRRR
jgi:hypothetical protein